MLFDLLRLFVEWQVKFENFSWLQRSWVKSIEVWTRRSVFRLLQPIIQVTGRIFIKYFLKIKHDNSKNYRIWSVKANFFGKKNYMFILIKFSYWILSEFILIILFIGLICLSYNLINNLIIILNMFCTWIGFLVFLFV